MLTMVFIKSKTLLLLPALLLSCSCSFWSKVPEQPAALADTVQLEQYFNALVDCGTPPGISLAVVKDGRIIYQKGFGWADEPRNIPMTSESVCHWWSITKIVTAIAILQLRDQGKLKLDDSVRTYVPFFDVCYPTAHSKRVTIGHLLTHSSGLPDPGWRIIGWIHHDGDPPVNQTELIKNVLPNFSTLEFEPGEDARYTNIGYMVLGAIIEKVTGQTYEDYVREKVLKPLALNHTDFLYTKAMQPYEAAGSHPVYNAMTLLLPLVAASYIRESSGNHIWFERVYTDQTPSTGLIGSATDAARLVAAYLNGGELDGHRILSKKSIYAMTKEDHIMKGTRGQGIGWQIYDDHGQLMIQHSGGGPGFRTEMKLFPEKNLGLVLFTNDVTCETWRLISLAATVPW